MEDAVCHGENRELPITVIGAKTNVYEIAEQKLVRTST